MGLIGGSRGESLLVQISTICAKNPLEITNSRHKSNYSTLSANLYAFLVNKEKLYIAILEKSDILRVLQAERRKGV